MKPGDRLILLEFIEGMEAAKDKMFEATAHVLHKGSEGDWEGEDIVPRSHIAWVMSVADQITGYTVGLRNELDKDGD